jgi:hypothetical protein
MTTFPNGRRYDQVDSTAQMLDWLKRGSGPTSNAGIFELYRQRAEELRHGQAPGPVAPLRAPAGVGAVQRLSGIHRSVSGDGTVENVGIGLRAADVGGVGARGWGRYAQITRPFARAPPHWCPPVIRTKA